MHACNVSVHGMRARHASAKESYVLHVSIQLDFCYITLLWGPPCSVPAVGSEVPQAFLLNTQMSQGAAEDGGALGWGQEAAAACHK